MIIFKKIRWKNFLSTGNTFTEVDLTSHRTNLIVGTNGAGKSTILDALTFSLFGKPFRKVNKPALVNSVNEKDCQTEIEFTIGKTDYRVVRGIKPNKFEIYCNGDLLDENSKAVDQQKHFEQNVLKMNYKSFTQIVVLGSSTFVPFMRLPLAQRRDIIEDILDIQIFSTMNTILKDKIRENGEEVRELDYQLDLLKDKVEIQKNYLAELDTKSKADIKKKQDKIETLFVDIDSIHLNVQKDLETINKLSEETKEYSNCSDKLKKLNTFSIKLRQKMNSCEKENQFFNDNTVCPTCTQELSDELRREKITIGKKKQDEMSIGFNELNDAIAAEEERLGKWTELTEEITSLNTTVSKSNYQINLLKNSVKEIESEIAEIESGTGDKKEAFKTLEQLVSDKKTASGEVASLKKDRDVLTTAGHLLKDNGIKTRIIKTYLPTMNRMIGDYLKRMDFYVNFVLNENFEETIKSRYRDIFSYESFSEGEKARIDIALLLTWRAVAKLKNSVDTNLLILDEIFDGSLDTGGSSELGWILRNFDENTNVFVISHKESLEGKFDRTVSFEKVKNFSVVTESEVETQ